MAGFKPVDDFYIGRASDENETLNYVVRARSQKSAEAKLKRYLRKVYGRNAFKDGDLFLWSVDPYTFINDVTPL